MAPAGGPCPFVHFLPLAIPLLLLRFPLLLCLRSVSFTAFTLLAAQSRCLPLTIGSPPVIAVLPVSVAFAPSLFGVFPFPCLVPFRPRSRSATHSPAGRGLGALLLGCSACFGCWSGVALRLLAFYSFFSPCPLALRRCCLFVFGRGGGGGGSGSHPSSLLRPSLSCSPASLVGGCLRSPSLRCGFLRCAWLDGMALSYLRFTAPAWPLSFR